MGGFINIPRQGGNAEFNSLKVQLTESSSITGRTVVVGTDGRFYYSTAAGGGGGSGTVTNVSVVSTNGFSGSVANSTTTPSITLSTTVTGILKGNGTSISAATAGTDYVIPGALSSYVLNSQTSSMTVLSASYASGSTSASYALTASYAMNGGGGGSLSGGTTNYIPLWTSATTLATSSMYQSGSNIGINTTSPTFNLVTAGQGVAMTALNTGTSGSATVKTYASASGALNTIEVSSWGLSESGSIFFGVSGSRLNSIVSYNESRSFVIGTYGTGSIVIGTNNAARLFISASGNIGINNTNPTLATLQINGNVSASSYTGSLLGTSSYATTASYALNGGSGGSTFPYVGNAIISGSLVITGSGLVVTGSTTSTLGFTGSLFGTASYANNASSSLSSSYAATASYANNFTVAGTLTAQTIVAQTITSSIDYVTGSTRFGSLITNTHVFTGSVSMTGSLIVIGPISASNFTGSLLGTASYANNASSSLSASYSLTASYITTAQTASYVNGNIHTSTNPALSASYALTASYWSGTVTSASYASSSTSASYSSTASYVNTLNQNVLITGSLTIGTSSLGSNENTLTLGARTDKEGGQLMLQSTLSSSFTSASMLDIYADTGTNAQYLRILRGSNAGSDAVISQYNLHTKQLFLPAYSSLGAFSGIPVAALGVDSTGAVITIQTGSQAGGSGVTINNNSDNYIITATGTANTINGESNLQFNGSTLTVTGNVTATSITSSGAIIAQANNAMYFKGGDDAEFWDINVANTVGIYGAQTQTVAGLKLGSTGSTLYGSGSNLGINTITPNSASLHVSGNVFAASFTGSLLGTASYATTASYALNGGSGTTFPYTGSAIITGSLVVTGSITSTLGFTGSLLGTAATSSYVTTAQTASFVTSSKVFGPYGANSILSASYASSSLSASYATTASYWSGTVISASYASSSTSASYASSSTSASYALSASWAPGGSGLSGGVNKYIPLWTGASSQSTSSLYQYSPSGSILTGSSLAVGNIVPSNTVGRIDASNDVVAFSTSDKRFKSNVTPISNPIEKITQIGGYEFDWIQNPTYHGNKGHDVGVIAQELEKILPEVVTTRDSGYKAVKYEKIVPLLIEAIKDQQKQIEDLQKQINYIVNNR